MIIAGFVAVVLGFVLPAGSSDAVNPEVVEDLVQDKLDQSLNDSVRRQIDGMARDAVADAIDENKLDLSRVSNEKVMEISEYAGTVLEDIKKNHDEVVFMYDMLNDKHKNMLHTVSEMTKTAETAKQTVRDAELTAKDAKDAVATLDAATARVKRAQVMEQHPERTAAAAKAVSAAVAAESAAPSVHSEEPERAPSESPQDEWAPINKPSRSAVAQSVSPETNAEPLSPPVKQAKTAPEQPLTGIDIVQTGNTPNTAKTSPRRTSGEPMSQNAQILKMHEAGKSNMVIARELGLGIGEVRLVIDLAKKQRGV